MVKERRLARSVSLNVPQILAESQINTLQNLRPRKSKTFKTKVLQFISTKLFANQVHSESIHTFTSSNFPIFIYFLRFFGLSYKVHQKESKTLLLFFLIYNLIVFCCQSLYGIFLLYGMYNNNNSSHYQWINVTHYSCLTIWILSIWLNFKIHSIKPRFVDEAFSSSSLEERHVEKRNFLIKFVSVSCIILIAMIVIIIEIARFNSNDRFGIFSPRSKRMPLLFVCGNICRIFEAGLHAICLLVILSNAALFVLISIAISNESSNLIISIKQYSLSQNLDHLIYRYQSIEKSVRILEKNFSTVLLAFIIAAVAGVFVSLSKKAKLMIMDTETGGMNVLCATVMFSICAAFTTMFSIYLNNQLDEFRSASHKLSDLQQQDSYCITSIKLLSFMLRLSYDTERIKVGKIFAVTPQAMIILILFFALIGICLFAVDEGCLNIF